MINLFEPASLINKVKYEEMPFSNLHFNFFPAGLHWHHYAFPGIGGIIRIDILKGFDWKMRAGDYMIIIIMSFPCGSCEKPQFNVCKAYIAPDGFDTIVEDFQPAVIAAEFRNPFDSFIKVDEDVIVTGIQSRNEFFQYIKLIVGHYEVCVFECHFRAVLNNAETAEARPSYLMIPTSLVKRGLNFLGMNLNLFCWVRP